MGRHKQREGRWRIEDQFSLTDSVRSNCLIAGARLWRATDREDEEPYILWLLPKTGEAVDADLAALLVDTVRRIRGVLARATARETLMDIIDVVEDAEEIGLRFHGADNTLDGVSTRAWDQLQNAARTIPGRVTAWHQIARLVRALGYLHAADLVHGGVATGTVFVTSINPLELKLGGYEGCIHLRSISDAGALRPARVASHAQDWRDLGMVAAQLLFQDQGGGALLLPPEQRMLDRLLRPPQFAHIDGASMAGEIESLCRELERLGSSGRQELVATPDRDVLRRDLPALTRGTVPATDTDRIIAFMVDDLNAAAPIAHCDPRRRDGAIEIFSERAVYTIRPQGGDPRIARIISCRARSAADRSFDALPVTPRIHVARDVKGARDRVARTGGGAIAWSTIGDNDGPASQSPPDLPQWHALILVEVASLLEGRLRHYPVEIIDVAEDGVIHVAPRENPDHDVWRAKFGRPTATTDLEREMISDDGAGAWTISASEALTLGSSTPMLTLEGIDDIDGRQAYRFRVDGTLPGAPRLFLRPMPDRGLEASVRRRLRHAVAARSNFDLLYALNDPESVGLDEALRDMAAPGQAPVELEPSKRAAWATIQAGHSLELVVGPPGVGKTFLVSRLAGSILENNPNARILISAQNHEALADMARKLREYLADRRIVARVERPADDRDETKLRTDARALLGALVEGETSPLLRARRAAVEDVLGDVGDETTLRRSDHEDILRDTEHLLLRSADVTLATANSPVLEEMLADGQQFDWVIVEEAARASGPELLGPLILGNRRVLIGDHRQLAPFDAVRKAKLYDGKAGEALLEGAEALIDAFPDLSEEVSQSIATVCADPVLRSDVLATALRFEQPFQEIAAMAEERPLQRPGGAVTMLTEQCRMHPALCELVSASFYGGRLRTASGVDDRASPLVAKTERFAAPLVVVDMPPLSRASPAVTAFETREGGTSPFNRAEAAAVLNALDQLAPLEGKDASLVILSPYTAQCALLRAKLETRVDPRTGCLQRFKSSKGDGTFVHTIDSFQGSEADLVIISCVRNNQDMGRRALGILGDRRRMNVLLSRARHQLVLVTSLRFLENATAWEDRNGDAEFDFLAVMLRQIHAMAKPTTDGTNPAASIMPCDERGRVAT